MVGIALSVPEEDRDKFVKLVLEEFENLHEGNAIRFGVSAQKNVFLRVVPTMERLRTLLKKFVRRESKAYNEAKGSSQFTGSKLTPDHIQGGPFAQPSRISIQVSSSLIPPFSEFCSGKIRKTAAEDFPARAFCHFVLKDAE